MSSDLQSALEFIKISDYNCLVVVTGLLYDYILTFSREIEYVWCKPWTRVSTMFVLVRYSGLYWSIIYALVGTSFLSGSLKMYAFKLDWKVARMLIINRCSTVYVLACWLLPVFFAATDLVMILRVYAMWDRSRLIFCVLFLLLFSQTVVGFIFCGIYDNPNTHLSVTINQVLGFASCNFSYDQISNIAWYSLGIQIVLGVLLLTLALIKTVKDLIEMYRATKEWQLNRYMRLLVRDGILYFIVNLFRLFSVIDALLRGSASNHMSALLMTGLSYLTVCPVVPRFIITVRELYDHEVEDRWQGVDAGFGALSQPSAIRTASRPTVSILGDVEVGLGPEVKDTRSKTAEVSLGEGDDNRV